MSFIAQNYFLVEIKFGIGGDFLPVDFLRIKKGRCGNHGGVVRRQVFRWNKNLGRWQMAYGILSKFISERLIGGDAATQKN